MQLSVKKHKNNQPSSLNYTIIQSNSSTEHGRYYIINHKNYNYRNKQSNETNVRNYKKNII